MDANQFASAMPSAWVDRLSVVGTPEVAREQIADLHRAGATSVVLIPVGDPLAALEQFARVLAP